MNHEKYDLTITAVTITALNIMDGLDTGKNWDTLQYAWDAAGMGYIEFCRWITDIAYKSEEMLAKAQPQNFPGVYEYEVSCPLGWKILAYVRETGELPGPTLWQAWLEKLFNEYFAQGETPDALEVPMNTPIFIASENPECCRKCGTRTITMSSRLEAPTTLEKCPNCGHTYILEQPEEGEE